MPTNDTRRDVQPATDGHVRRGLTGETARLARVLARAFEGDPVSAFLLPAGPSDSGASRRCTGTTSCPKP